MPARSAAGPDRRSRRRGAEGAAGPKSRPRSRGHRGGLSRLRQPGRRRQPQCRPHGPAAGGAAGERARSHGQPPLRLGAGGGRQCRPRHRAPGRWNSPLPAASNPCPARLSSWARPSTPFSAHPRSRTRPSAGASSIRGSRRNTASIPCRRPPRTSPRNSRSSARRRTPSRSARSSVPWPRSRSGFLAEEIVPVEVHMGKGASHLVEKDEHPARRYDPGGARQAEAGGPQSRHGHRRQCLGRQ